MEGWHPDAMIVQSRRYPRGAGSYADGYPWRQVVHTTEGGSDDHPEPRYWPDPEAYYGHQGWPHATIGRVDGRAWVVQHMPITGAARTLEPGQQGIQTNFASAVQVEVCWRAARMSDLPDDLAERLGSWLLFVARETGAPLTGPAFLGPGAGVVLATKTASQRMWPHHWAEFTGVCGHQHVPFQSHWDPGAFDLDRALLLALEDDMPTAQEIATEVWAARRTHNAHGQPVENTAGDVLWSALASANSAANTAAGLEVAVRVLANQIGVEGEDVIEAVRYEVRQHLEKHGAVLPPSGS